MSPSLEVLSIITMMQMELNNARLLGLSRQIMPMDINMKVLICSFSHIQKVTPLIMQELLVIFTNIKIIWEMFVLLMEMQTMTAL
ncbi:hypothetical protein D3C84_368940 [compost metagenome]